MIRARLATTSHCPPGLVNDNTLVHVLLGLVVHEGRCSALTLAVRPLGFAYSRLPPLTGIDKVTRWRPGPSLDWPAACLTSGVVTTIVTTTSPPLVTWAT